MFRRITSGAKFIPQIDGLRFVAISLVFLLHVEGISRNTFGSASHWFQLGDRGVHLFFVISGFILALPFARHYLTAEPAVNLKKYFWRRLTRLEPPYILNILFFFVLFHLINLHHNHPDAGPAHLFASLTYTHDLIFGGTSTLNGVAWSLEVEVQFYVLMPLLARIYTLGKFRRPILALLIIAFSVLHFGPHPHAIDMSVIGNFQFFAAGLLLADLYVCGLPRKSMWWDAASVCLWPSVVLVPGDLFMAALPLICIVLYIAAFSGPISSTIFSLSPFTAIGGMCYSIYLFHFQILSWASRHALSSGLFWCLGIGCTIAFCTVFFLLVERPCMRPDWPRALLNFIRRTPASTNKDTVAVRTN